MSIIYHNNATSSALLYKFRSTQWRRRMIHNVHYLSLPVIVLWSYCSTTVWKSHKGIEQGDPRSPMSGFNVLCGDESPSTHINRPTLTFLTGVGGGIFRKYQANRMAVDAPDAGVHRSAAVTLLTAQDKRILVFHQGRISTTWAILGSRNDNKPDYSTYTYKMAYEICKIHWNYFITSCCIWCIWCYIKEVNKMRITEHIAGLTYRWNKLLVKVIPNTDAWQ